MPGRPLALVADVGGTNVRFALRGPRGTLSRIQVLATADYRGLGDAAEAYLSRVRLPDRPKRAAFAVACPITGDRVSMTNRAWSFSIAELKRRLGLADLAVINDFVAVALAVPSLRPGDTLKIGRGSVAAGMPVAVLGPGTGLGVSLLVPDGRRWLPVATEGGHVTLPAADPADEAVIAPLRERFGHVSAERVLSGPGLVNLYLALAATQGRRPDDLDPEDITDRALAGRDPLAVAALERFCAMLGTVAGDLALTTGARGGVYIAGGIVPRFGRYLSRSSFRARFEAKGRFRPYMRAIPTWIVTAELPALAGLNRLLDQAA